jgi:hypothetical protein
MKSGQWNNRAASSRLCVPRPKTVRAALAALLMFLGALTTVLATAAIGRTASGATPGSPAPLSASNFVIVEPTGNVTTHGGSVSLAPGSGQHQFVFDTVGYRFSVINTSKILVPGQYSTSVDTWLSLVNDPACEGGTTTGSAEIDQATYDPTGAVTSAAVQFQFRCYTGTYVYGTIAYQLVNTNEVNGYYLYSRSGGLVGFGNASYLTYLGTPYTRALPTSVVGMATTTDGYGYVMAGNDGGVFAFGDAQFYGSMGGKPLDAPIVGIARSPSSLGYWLAGSDGGIFAFGDAQFYGSMGGKPLNARIVGIAPTPDGRGYWEVASDGGIFAFGDAQFYGSMGGKPLNAPIVGLAADPGGLGYWLVAADGGLFAFGDAQFYGSMGGKPLNARIVGIAASSSGHGYSLAAFDGAVFSFGDAIFQGSAVSTLVPQVPVGIAFG